MKIKSLLVTIGLCLTILSSAMALITIAAVLDNHGLRRELRTVRTDLDRARIEVSQVRRDTTEASERLAAKQNELQELEKEFSRLKVAKASDEASASAAPRAYRLRAYLGNQYLGMAWMVPSVRPKAAESGQWAYEPVVVLDESLKRNFVVHKTNLVEREVSRETTVNYNYAYPYYFPVFIWKGSTNPSPNCDTNWIPVQPKPPSQVSTAILNPPSSKPPLATRAFVPKERQFLPAANQVRTEPIRVQANLAPGVGNPQPQSIVTADRQRRTTQPWSPSGL